MTQMMNIEVAERRILRQLYQNTDIPQVVFASQTAQAPLVEQVRTVRLREDGHVIKNATGRQPPIRPAASNGASRCPGKSAANLPKPAPASLSFGRSAAAPARTNADARRRRTMPAIRMRYAARNTAVPGTRRFRSHFRPPPQTRKDRR